MIHLKASPRWRCTGAVAGITTLLVACGGGGDRSTTASAATNRGTASEQALTATAGEPAISTRDAVRLADQATFGPTEALLGEISAQGASSWVDAQLGLSNSRYTRGGGDEIHRHAGAGDYCQGQGDGKVEECQRDNASVTPLLWDFYRNALTQPDQLRQRVAFALQQIVVVSGFKLTGTYGFRLYYNNLLEGAFGNYRQVLRKVALSPVMGDYLTHANNDKAAPNENFARELLQLFSIGTCELEPDGSLKGGACRPTYDNNTIRAYAYALTGWTYPAGGAARQGCAPAGWNCTYYGGDMVPVERFHDTETRPLLGSASIAAGTPAPAALETVLDSLMAHPNMGPFIGRQLILHLVGSNPSRAYVGRVAAAFDAGRHGPVGSGTKGDLAATVRAVLLDPEARPQPDAPGAGKLREPALLFTGVLRALNGRSDGDPLGTPWGDAMRQSLFRPTSVFNYFKPVYPVPGTSLEGPEFAIHGAGAALARLNYLSWLIDEAGAPPDPRIPDALGTAVDLRPFIVDAGEPGQLVDRFSRLAIGGPLPPSVRPAVVAAVESITLDSNPDDWAQERVKAAAYLVYASPDYQVQR